MFIQNKLYSVAAKTTKSLTKNKINTDKDNVSKTSLHHNKSKLNGLLQSVGQVTIYSVSYTHLPSFATPHSFIIYKTLNIFYMTPTPALT